MIVMCFNLISHSLLGTMGANRFISADRGEFLSENYMSLRSRI
jgi:hypothetical protein